MKRKQIIAWIKTHKKQTYIGAGVFSVLLIGGITFAISRSGTGIERIEPTIQVENMPETVPSPLTGVQVKRKAAERPVTMVIIENSPDARPQSAVRDAGIVFESIAEGGITRFVTLFQEAKPDPIGPVRSLRPYFTDWALTYDASVAHVGGSAEALEEVGPLGVKDLDQFSNGDSYYRTTDRYAPHNVYTDFKLLDALNKSKKFTKSEFTSLPRKEDAPADTVTAKNISVNFSSYLYQADFIYKKKTNSYDRLIAGTPDKDRESGKIISPKVVVVLNTPYTVSSDGRYHYDLVGKGKATVFQDGTVTKGTWTRDKRSGQFIFKDQNNVDIAFNAGQTWFAALSPEQKATY